MSAGLVKGRDRLAAINEAGQRPVPWRRARLLRCARNILACPAPSTALTHVAAGKGKPTAKRSCEVVMSSPHSSAVRRLMDREALKMGVGSSGGVAPTVRSLLSALESSIRPAKPHGRLAPIAVPGSAFRGGRQPLFIQSVMAFVRNFPPPRCGFQWQGMVVRMRKLFPACNSL
jgi:hypothetical protein